MDTTRENEQSDRACDCPDCSPAEKPDPKKRPTVDLTYDDLKAGMDKAWETEKPKLNPMPGPSLSDPWAHRSKGMRCNTCMWFACKPAAAIQIRGDELTRLGRCRRHAPTMSGYPVVFPNDWCGDHKLDENKR